MKPDKLRVALVSGGKSGEREVSLNSGIQVGRALDPDKYIVTHYDPARDLNRLIDDAPRLDVALLILHGRWGEDGTIQGLLEMIGLPYLGSGVMSSAMCMDKRATKDLYLHHGLPTPNYEIIDGNNPLGPDEIIERLGLPVVIKPSCEGSSLGLGIPRDRDQLAEALREAMACGRYIIAEEFIDGLEITSSILGNDKLEALPLIEIIPGDKFEFFDYEAKYTPGATNEICPARLDDDLTRTAQELGIRAHQAMYCRGFSRSDMMLKDGRFWLLETNTIPGLTETSLYPKAAAAAGMSFGALMDRLIELALEDAGQYK